MARYKYYPTRHFSAHLDKIRHRDPEGYERIMTVIDRLLDNPADSDGTMKGEHRGRFKKYVGRKDYRLIYHYCESCLKPNEKLAIACEHCGRIEEDSVIFYEVYHKNEKTRLKFSDF